MSGIYQVYTMIINFLGFPDGSGRQCVTVWARVRRAECRAGPGRPGSCPTEGPGPNLSKICTASGFLPTYDVVRQTYDIV